MLTQAEKDLLAQRFPYLTAVRPEDSNKGTFGTLGIIGSAPQMNGACVLAGSAALKTGCGKVIIGFNQNKLPLAIVENAPELILNIANELINNKYITAWVIGCGLGIQSAAVILIKNMLQYINNGAKVLIDADGLNILSIQAEAIKLTENCIITPHPKEASRLLACSVEKIQQNRVESAIKLAGIYHCWVVLKGHATVIAAPNGKTWINETGNSGLATAGSGDVLSGIIGSLLAQNIPLSEAAQAGVWLHGKAADDLVSQGIGPIGLTAHELINSVRMLRNQLVRR